jgi:hypothetical protein
MGECDALSPEAEELLRKLSRRNTRLVRSRTNEVADECDPAFILTQASSVGSNKNRRISSDLVLALSRRQLIASDDGGFVLSETGRAFLRRKLARTDAFQQQHQQRAIETTEIEGVRKPALVDETESPLGWLRRRKDKSGQPLIDAAQFEAGERLRRDFHYAGLTPRVTASWDGIPGDRASRRAAPGASTNLREQTVAAQQRVRRALEAVGPDLGDLLFDVCCHLKGLEETEKAKGWPRRSAKLVLQIALKELARHYGLLRSAAEAANNSSRRLMHWGAPDYKPQIQDF